MQLNSRHPAPAPPAGALDQLTPRETEVLSLIARGLSNAEISDTLVISEDTAKTHIRHILAKPEPARPRPGRPDRLRDRPRRPGD